MGISSATSPTFHTDVQHFEHRKITENINIYKIISKNLSLSFRSKNTVLPTQSAKTELFYTSIDSSLNKRVLIYGEPYDYNGDRGTIENLSFSAKIAGFYKLTICSLITNLFIKLFAILLFFNTSLFAALW